MFIHGNPEHAPLQTHTTIHKVVYWLAGALQEELVDISFDPDRQSQCSDDSSNSDASSEDIDVESSLDLLQTEIRN